MQEPNTQTLSAGRLQAMFNAVAQQRDAAQQAHIAISGELADAIEKLARYEAEIGLLKTQLDAARSNR